MADYIRLPVAVEPDDLFDTFVSTLQERWTDWEPSDEEADTWVGTAGSRIAAQLAETAQAVADDIYVDSGTRLDNILPIAPEAATGLVTIALQDANGYTIPDGSVFGIDIGGGQSQNFQLVDPLVVPNGTSTVTGVSVTATEAGEAANGLTGAALIVDAPSEVVSVTFTTVTGGGLEGETLDAYLNRLTIARRLRAPRPINALDFADFAREMVAGVSRCGVLDGYDPAHGYSGGYVESNMATWTKLAVTLTPLRDDGEPADSAPHAAVNVLFNGDPVTNTPGIRENNWLVSVANPHYTTIGVRFTGTTWDGWSPADVAAAAQVALQQFLSPANYGQPDQGEERRWENRPVVHGSDLYAVLKSVDGMKAVTSLEFGQDSTVTDDYSVDTIGSAAWTVVTGAGTISVTGGQLVPSSTALKLLTRAGVSLIDSSGWHKFIAGSAIGTGGAWNVVFKYIDVNNYLRVRAATDTGRFSIRKIDATVDSQLGADAAFPIAVGQSYWLGYTIVGNVITAEAYAADPHTNPPVVSLSYTLTGADATKFGAGVTGGVGVRLTPGSTTERYDDYAVGPALSGSDYTLPVTDAEPMPLTRAGAIYAGMS